MLKRGDYKLRPVTEDDFEQLLRWRNSERVRAFMYSDHLITSTEHRKWFEQIQQSEFPVVLIFEYRGRPIGVKNISRIDRQHNRCHWGFYLGETGIPKGSGTIMGYMAQEYIFLIQEFHKLCAEAFACNKASLCYHERLGFREEGLFTQHILKNNRYEDIVCFAILRSEWLRQRLVIEKNVFTMGKL